MNILDHIARHLAAHPIANGDCIAAEKLGCTPYGVTSTKETSMIGDPHFKTFVKLADQPAQKRCQLKARSVHVGHGRRGQGVVYLDVAPTYAFDTVVMQAVAAKAPMQLGLELCDGRRMLFTGRAELNIPVMAGAQMEVLQRLCVRFTRLEHFR
jgi:hypothetical protein